MPNLVQTQPRTRLGFQLHQRLFQKANANTIVHAVVILSDVLSPLIVPCRLADKNNVGGNVLIRQHVLQSPVRRFAPFS